MSRLVARCALVVALTAPGAWGAEDPLLDAASAELSRGIEGLELPGLESPYYLGYWIRDQRDVTIEAAFGTLVRSGDQRSRLGRIDLRVGSPTLDNSGFVSRDRSLSASPLLPLALDDDPLALRRSLWYQTDLLYKAAAANLEAKKAFLAQKMGELRAPDFSLSGPVELEAAADPAGEKPIDKVVWEERLRNISGIMRKYPAITEGSAILFFRQREERYASSEGTRVRQHRGGAGIEVNATALAKDGMELTDFTIWYDESLSATPERIAQEVESMCRGLVSRLDAPAGEDYLGPVLIEGQAACELVGQTLVPAVSADKAALHEDERMGGRGSGALLAGRLNRRVLPTFLSVRDDPGAKDIGGVALHGGYSVDQEGVVPEAVNLVEAGFLKGLLMTRAPHEKIRRSNGHARADSGMPGARASNVIVTNSEPLAPKKLRKKLLELVDQQELPYGIVVQKLNDELLDSRGGPNALTTPLRILRVYPDGREQEIRGMAWGQFGLHILRDIVAAGDVPYVYNYYQGGRGGSLPVSIASPALLLEEVELKAVDRSQNRPPQLPSPFQLAAGPAVDGERQSGEQEEAPPEAPEHAPAEAAPTP